MHNTPSTEASSLSAQLWVLMEKAGLTPYVVLSLGGLALLWTHHALGGLLMGAGFVYIGLYEHHRKSNAERSDRWLSLGVAVLGAAAIICFLVELAF